MRTHFDFLREHRKFAATMACVMADDLRDREGVYQGSVLESYVLQAANHLEVYKVCRLLFYTKYRYWREQSFVISHDIQELLHNTDLGDTPVTGITTPYDCVYLSFPDTHIKTSKGYPVIGVYVSKGLIEQEPEMPWTITDDVWLMFCCDTGADQVFPDTYHTHLTTIHDGSAEDQIQDYAADEDITEWWSSKEEYLSALRLSVNTLFLIESESCDVDQQTPDKRRRRSLERQRDRAHNADNLQQLNKKLQSTPDRHITYLKVPGVQHSFDGYGTDTGRTHKRHFVRGHWRQQVCGKGRTKRKRKWIMPHLRGTGQTTQRDHYKVG